MPKVQIISPPFPSPLIEVYATKEFQEEWENDVRFHVTRNLLYLRRYRRMTQAKLAAVIGTSQSAIARMENGQENITLDTLQRLLKALGGRLRLGLPPREISNGSKSEWWDDESA